MSKLGLDRVVLANITNNNQEAIKALERVFNDVSVLIPEQVAAAINQASQAISSANQALGVLGDVSDALDYLVSMAARADQVPEPEDYRPALQLGSMAVQESDNVDITGGTVGLSAGTFALPSFYIVDRATGFYRIGAHNWGYSVNAVKKLDITNTRLTASLELYTTGGFSLFNGLLRSSGASELLFDGASTLANAEAFFENNDSVFAIHASTSSGVVKALNLCATGGGSPQVQITPTGVAIQAELGTSGAFGVNGAAPQLRYGLPATATDLPTAIARINAVCTLLINNGQAS